MMNRLLSFLLFMLACSSMSAQGYQVNLQAPAYRNGIAYLTYYRGANLNIADSAAFSSAGTAVFKGPGKLEPGIYVLVFPGKQSRIEFLIDKEQKINIKAPDLTDLVNKTVITGSKENILYQEYQKYVATKGTLLNAERDAYAASKTKADSLLHEKQYNTYNSELNAYREDLIKKNPNAMLTALLKAMKEPIVPNKKPATHEDSLNNYNYYKAHYWDGVTFMDDRIINTPFFLRKLDNYYHEILEQDAATIIKDLDYKMLLARSSPELYKFLLNWFTDEYINPKYMGQDAVFVHLFEKYHSKGLSKWLNEKQMEAITRRAYMLMANLVGEPAANLEFLDRSEKVAPLYNVDAAYTIVAFWDPNCGHCKLEIPRLDSFYRASWKQHGVKIYAVLTPEKGPDAVKAEWIKFIDANNLGEWTHVYESVQMEKASRDAQKPSFRQLYDISSTPTLYLLDKDKRIVGKKLTLDQMGELLEVKWKTTRN